MALGTLLFNEQIPAKYPFGYALTIKDKLAVIADFGYLHDEWHQLETDNNLNNTGNFPVDHNITSIYYSKDENVYWAILSYITTLTPNVYNTRILKLNDSGQLLTTLNFRDIIPASDRYPVDWDHAIGSSITLSYYKSEIYGIFSRSKRVYRISKTGTYLGYFDLEGATTDHAVGGITTDDMNVWYNVFNELNLETLSFYKSDTSGKTLETFSIINSDPDFNNVYFSFDLSFSDQPFTNKSALWFRTASETLTNQSIIAVKIESQPCQDAPIINASNKDVLLNSIFDPMLNVTATDCSGKDITNLIIVLENSVDASQLGVYTVIYEVTSSNGKTTQKAITVSVVAKIPITREQTLTDSIQSVALVSNYSE